MNRLWVRLTIGFLLTFLLLLLLVTLVVNYSVTSSFRQYVDEMDVNNFGSAAFAVLSKAIYDSIPSNEAVAATG